MAAIASRTSESQQADADQLIQRLALQVERLHQLGPEIFLVDVLVQPLQVLVGAIEVRRRDALVVDARNELRLLPANDATHPPEHENHDDGEKDELDPRRCGVSTNEF
jgi:hypothetical protein